MGKKISWSTFIDKHPEARHLVSTGTLPPFKKPSGLSPRNTKPYPTIQGIVIEALGQSFSGDWAYTTLKEPGTRKVNGKSRKVVATSHLFVFEKPQDANLVGRLLGAGQWPEDKPFPENFTSAMRGIETDIRRYADLIRPLGY